MRRLSARSRPGGRRTGGRWALPRRLPTGGGESPPTNLTPPTLSGVAKELQVVSTTDGTWLGADPGYTYFWERGPSGGPYSLIVGAGDPDYVVQQADVGLVLRSGVIATNGGGPTTAHSAESAIVVQADPPTITSPATGLAVENEDYLLPLTADQDVTWAITGGTDASLFSLAGNQLTLTGRDADIPGDISGGDNVYDVEVTATSTATGYTATLAHSVTVQPVAGALSIGSAFGASATFLATIDLVHTIPQAANRILLVQVAFSDSTDDTNGIQSVTWYPTGTGGTGYPLIRIQEPGYTSDYRENGTDGVDNALFYLVAPPVATNGTVRVVRSTATGTRGAIHVENLSNMVQQGPTAVSRTVNAALSNPAPDTLNVPGDDQITIWANAVQLFTSTNTVTAVPSGWTQAHITRGAGAIFAAALAYEEAAAGNASGTLSVTGGTDNRIRVSQTLMASFKALPHQDVDPIYYVGGTNPTTGVIDGADTNDGLSPATAFASPDKIASLSPLPAGAKVYFQKGHVHRRAAAFDATKDLASFSGSGTASSPIIMDSYGAGADPIFEGAVPVTAGWGPTTAGSAFLQANGQENTLGVGYEFNNFPRIDGQDHQPACWCASGNPSSNRAWDDSQKGSDSCTYPDPATIQAAGTSTPDPAKKVRWSKSGPTTTITLEDPAIAAHYGADSPVGRAIVWRRTGNWEEWSTITGYDQAASTITWSVTSPSSTAYEPSQGFGQEFYWRILYHPLDIVRAGQFGWSGDPEAGSVKMYVAWLPGTHKSVSRYNHGLRITGAHWNIGNFAYQATSGNQAGGRPSMLELALVNSTLGIQDFQQCVDDTRSNCLGVIDNPSSGLDILKVTADRCPTQSLLRLEKLTDSLIREVKARHIGRTAVFFGGVGNTPSSGNTVTNVDVCEHFSVHGNPASAYQGANNNTIDKFMFAGGTTGDTAQTLNAATIPVPKGEIRKRGFIAMIRPISTVPGVAYNRDGATYGIRLDDGSDGTRYQQVAAVLQSAAGAYIGNDDQHSTNDGLTFDRCVMEGVVFSSTLNPDGVKSGFGVSLTDLLSTTSLFGGTAADWAAQGATATRSEIDVSQTWANGTLTSKMHEYLTRADGGGGSGGAHAPVQLGPDSIGWVIPAYPAIDNMVDLVVTTTDVPRGYQAGKTVGHIVKTRPGSTFDALGGADAASFFIDRGVLVAKVNLVNASYTIDIVERNAAAPNGPTHTTTVVITTSI